LEVLADDEWFVVGVALVGGVSGKRIGKEGAEEQGRLCATSLASGEAETSKEWTTNIKE